MAGVKGRSGGARPGSGPKRKPVPKLKADADDPLEFLLQVMQDKNADPKMRVRAAIAATRYVHNQKGGGVMVGRKKAAHDAAKGKFAPAAPPKLVVNNQ